MEVCGYCSTARAPPPQPWGVPGFAPAVRMLYAAMEPLCRRASPSAVPMSCSPSFRPSASQISFKSSSSLLGNNFG